MRFFREYRIVRDEKEKCVYVKKGFRRYATYSVGAWLMSDAEILDDYDKNKMGDYT